MAKKKSNQGEPFGTPNQLGLTTKIFFFFPWREGPDILMIITTKALLLPMWKLNIDWAMSLLKYRSNAKIQQNLYIAY